MSTFDERESAFENKFAHDEEMKFKAAARRNKLLGLWLAPQIGMDDPDAYASAVVVADLAEDGDEDVIRKVMGDIEATGAAIDESMIRAKLVEFSVEAKDQILRETG